MGRLEVVIVRALDALAAHGEQWNRLAFESPQQSPMLSYAWISAYLEHRLQHGASWLCLFAYDGRRLVGVLPLVVSPRRVVPGMGGERAILQTPYDPHTISISPLVAAGRAGEVIPLLVREAGKAHRGWFCIEMERIPESAPVLAVLEGAGARPDPLHAPLSARLGFFTKELRSTGAYLPIQGRFDDYRASLSRNFRNNLNKARNKLRKRSGVTTIFLEGEDASEAQLPRFAAVEASSWKGEAGTAIEKSPELMAFYTTLTRRLSQAGWLEWHFLEAEGKTIAGNLAVRLARTLLVWKLGYDETYARCSPGSLLFEQLVERAYAAGNIQEIDLMTDWGWYDNWKMDKRRCFDLYLYSRRAAPLVFGYAPRRAKAYLREVPAVQQARTYLREAPALRRSVDLARRVLGTAGRGRRS